jgi:hypothetical protein
MPRRHDRFNQRAMPLVRALPEGFSARGHTRGIAPIFFFKQTARHSLASHQAAKPKRTVRSASDSTSLVRHKQTSGGVVAAQQTSGGVVAAQQTVSNLT